MIRIYCAKADATLLETETLTAGMVNTPNVLFTFSADWEGLGKTAIVRAGTVIKEVVLQNNQITIPAECLAKAGVNLIVGVWGGNFVTELPTVWCACGEIQDSTNPSAALNHEEASSSNVAQMLAAMERAEAALDQIENANWDDVVDKISNQKVNRPTSSPNGRSGQILQTNGDGSTQWVDNAKVNLPDEDPNGTAGQLLRTNGDGTTEWVSQGLPTDEQTGEAVSAWLDVHPEATTTVQDGVISYSKLNQALSADIKLSKSRSIDTNEGTNVEYFGQYLVNSVNGLYPFTQGMCIANSTIYQMHVRDPENDNPGVCRCGVVDLLTGNVSINTVEYTSHFNDITYHSKLEKILALNGGTITIINPDDLSIVTTVSIPLGYGHYRLAYISGDDFAIAKDTYIAFCSMDSNYTITVKKQVNIESHFTSQSMCYYDEHLYLASYITPNYYDVPPDYAYGVFISIFDLEGNFVKSISIDNTYGEIEGIDVYNDELILSFQRFYDEIGCTQSFLRLPPYRSSNKYTLRNFNDRGFQREDPEITIYVDRDYTGFFCDGTSEKPFVGAADAVNYANHMNTAGVSLNIKGNQGLIRFNMPGINYYVNGDPVARCHIKRVTGFAQYLRFTDCDIGASTMGSSAIQFRSGLLMLRNCTLSCNSSYDCINIGYGMLYMLSSANSFLSGNNAITANGVQIVNTVNNVYSVSGAPYNLTSCTLMDSVLPSGYVADEKTNISSTQIITGLTYSNCAANSTYSSFYMRDHVVSVNAILEMSEAVETGSVLLISGLPVPKTKFEFIATGRKSPNYFPLVMQITADGELRLWYAGAVESGTLIYVNATYIT